MDSNQSGSNEPTSKFPLGEFDWVHVPTNKQVGYFRAVFEAEAEAKSESVEMKEFKATVKATVAKECKNQPSTLQCASHLTPLLHLNDRERTIDRMCGLMSQHASKFDAIAVSGVSGALLGLPVAIRLKKHLVVVRKKRSVEARHSYHDVEGLYGFYDNSTMEYELKYTRWNIAILDDLIDAGDTMDRMWTLLTERNQVPIGIFLYNHIGLKSEYDSCCGWKLPVFKLTD